VTAREDGSNELERTTVVGKLEARLDSTWISVNSPLGSALLDSRPGQTVDVETPDGPMQYEVLRIVGASRSESRFPCRLTMTRNRLSSVRSSRKQPEPGLFAESGALGLLLFLSGAPLFE
jgi:hypothetical protein